jgi:hypothetical protein
MLSMTTAPTFMSFAVNDRRISDDLQADLSDLRLLRNLELLSSSLIDQLEDSMSRSVQL